MDSDPYVIKLVSAGSEEDSSSVSATNGGTTKNPKLEHMRSKIKGLFHHFSLKQFFQIHYSNGKQYLNQKRFP